MPNSKDEIIKEIELREVWMKRIQEDFESESSIGREVFRYGNPCAEKMVNKLFDEKEDLNQKLMKVEFEEWLKDSGCPFKLSGKKAKKD